VTTQDSRPAQLAWLHWAAANPHLFIYSEGAARMSSIGVWPIKTPITADCSAFDTWVAWVSGGNDPNGLGFDHNGFTGTFLSHEEHLAMWVKNSAGKLVEDLLPCDYVVYGPGTGLHVAAIVEVHGNDILTVSFGDSQGPVYTWVNAPTSVPSRGYQIDGRQPQTYLANHTNTTSPLRFPPGYLHTANPTTAQLAAHGYVLLANPAEARLAVKNHYQLYVWNGVGFSNAPANLPAGTHEYASKNYKTLKNAVGEE